MFDHSGPDLAGDHDASFKKDNIPLSMRIRAAVATALGAAAARAKLLADQEDREIEHLLAIITGTQVAQFLLPFWGLCWVNCLHNCLFLCVKFLF